MKTERDKIRLPAHWSHHLITGDARGLTPEQIAEIADAIKPFRDQGWHIIELIASSRGDDGKADYILQRQRTFTSQYGKKE
jgi:hypothetical protein